MSAAAVLLLVPHVLLLPPEAPADLAPVAETCAQAVSASPDLRVTRLGAAQTPDAAVSDRLRADLDDAVRAYRELRFRDAKERAERVVAALEAEATGPADFDLLLQARMRLALTHLAQRRQAPARALLEAAARQAPTAQITEADWPPNLVAAWEAARTAVAGEPVAPLGATVQTSVPGLEATTWVDGRAVQGALPSLPPGDHVVVATAPGHELRRQVVRVPAASPVTIVLPATTVAPEGAVVLATSLEGAGGRVRVTVRRRGGGQATRETDVAGAPSAAREMAETLAGVPRAVAAAGSARGHVAAGGGAGRGAGSPTRGGGGTGRTESGGGSIFGRWWFWTIVGGAATVGLLVAVGASRRDPGTDVHVGVAR